MTLSADHRELLSNALGLCTLARPSHAKHGRQLNLNNSDPIPVPVTVWAELTKGERLPYRSLTRVEQLCDFERFSACWLYDGVAVTFDVTNLEMTDTHLKSVAHNIIVQEGRTNQWRAPAAIDVTFRFGHIAIPDEIQEVLQRALCQPAI